MSSDTYLDEFDGKHGTVRCWSCDHRFEVVRGSAPTAVEQLAGLLKRAGMQVTHDPDRNFTFPCHLCGVPGPHRLCTVGTYTQDLPGNLRRGDPVERSVCVSCREATGVVEG